MWRPTWLFIVLLALFAGACATDDGTPAGDGGRVTIFGAFTGRDADGFQLDLDAFEQRTGIEVVYEGSDDFETQLPIRAQGGNPPDIAFWPQPGAFKEFAEAGDLVDLGAFIDEDATADAYSEYLVGLGTVDGTMYGGWVRINVKSLIWYPVPEFDDADYEIPETWDELIDLSDEIKADGSAPWCFGMESSGATGWVMTDWMEDIMLRTAGPDVYDQWVNHEIPFDDPAVVTALEHLGEIVHTDGYVVGGTDAILAVDFRDAQNPMFEDPPECWLHRQASFIAGLWPEGTVAGVDSDAFAFPKIDADLPETVLGAGDILGVFNDRPEVRQVVEFLLSDEMGLEWGALEDSGYISPNVNFPIDTYTNDILRAQAEIAVDALKADGFRFDGSDLMPAAVGAGTFWSAMVRYVQDGPGNEEAVLGEVETSWPAS